MAVRIPLIMADGARVKTLEELKEHFDLAAVLTYYNNGRLIKWLRVECYDEEAEKVAALDSASDSFKKDLCEILGVPYSETESSQSGLADAMERNERRERLKQHTADDAILEAIDSVAFTQEELAELLVNGQKLVYLCGERFALPSMDGITYIGVNNPEVYLPGGFSDENCVDVEYLDTGAACTSETTSRVHRVKAFTTGSPLEIWRKAAEQGNPIAELEMANAYLSYYQSDSIVGMEAYEWYLKSANHGNAEAQYRMGLSYYNGGGISYLVDGIDYQAKAFEYFTKAAEQEHSDAQYYLGLCYSKGVGVEGGRDKAFQWFMKAAEQGNSRAQLKVGNCYYNGEGVAQDYKTAAKYFDLAAINGDSEIQSKLGDCYYNLAHLEYSLAFPDYDPDAPEDSDYDPDEVSFRWLLAAAERGKADAEIEVGIHYIMKERNPEEALKWADIMSAHGVEGVDFFREMVTNYVKHKADNDKKNQRNNSKGFLKNLFG